MGDYEELITPFYTLFCLIKSIGKTSMGYKTLFEQIKNSPCLEFFKRQLGLQKSVRHISRIGFEQKNQLRLNQNETRQSSFLPLMFYIQL